ncbi:hypothetical protein Dxin01_04214 [Deinococcus xinjiangensis]|uniref:Lipoprotein n=1 Tax=Deinococcus xinjiangensis TaxID=457454 RepID=A0ABP9VGU2_9DEIO
MQRPVISLLVCLLLAGCGNTPGGRTYRVSHTGVECPPKTGR